MPHNDPCGCYMSNGFNYCPMQKAAPSLLEALERVNLLWGRGNDDWTPLAYWEAYPESRERTFNEEAQRVGAIMESAIAAARGEVVPGA